MVEQAALSGDVPVRGMPVDRATSIPMLITKAVRPEMDANIALGRIRDTPYGGATLWREVEIRWPNYANYCDDLIPSEVGVGLTARTRREATQLHTQDGPTKTAQKTRSRRRGPKRGSVGYSVADRKLFPEMGRLLRKTGSAYAAAITLVDEDRVAGRGGRESKAKRLAARYLKERRRSVKTR